MRNFPPSLFVVLAAILFTAPLLAQDSTPAGGPPERRMDGPRRQSLLQQLELSPEQRQRIRQMNQERKPLMEAAGLRLREANRALDMAIYADSLNEEEVATRLRDFQAAQAEVARLRFRGELELRKVLTVDQLNRFRTIRERFTREREMRQNRRRKVGPNERPMQRLRDLPPRRITD